MNGGNQSSPIGPRGVRPTDANSSQPVAVPGALRIAAVLILLESLALAAAGVFLIVATITGSPSEIGRALFGAVLAIGTGVALAAGARALLRLNVAVRTPIVVIELLALPVAYSLAFDSGQIGYGAPILIVALAVLYLLFTPPVRAAFDRNPLNPNQ